MRREILTLVVLLLLHRSLSGQTLDLGTNNFPDGDWVVTSNQVVDLSTATTDIWSANIAGGVYDHARWVVVYKFTSIDIQGGATVTFANHPSGAPVMFLVDGDVTIAGTINLNGANSGTPGLVAPGGPGGFAGGKYYDVFNANTYGAGYGPGGAGLPQTGGSYRLPGGNVAASPQRTYGNEQIVPLVGGSGGAAGSTSRAGGGGGGALLIACRGAFSLSGSILANGGGGSGGTVAGGGSGGAVKLIAGSVLGSGSIRVEGGAAGQGGATVGGRGRIRLEVVGTVSSTLDIYFGGPTYSSVVAIDPAVPVQLFPPTTAPTVRITSVNGQVIPTGPPGPLARLDRDLADVFLHTDQPVPFEIVTNNCESTSEVTLRIVPKDADPVREILVPATLVGPGAGPNELVWTASALFADDEVSTVLVKVIRPTP